MSFQVTPDLIKSQPSSTEIANGDEAQTKLDIYNILKEGYDSTIKSHWCSFKGVQAYASLKNVDVTHICLEHRSNSLAKCQNFKHFCYNIATGQATRYLPEKALVMTCVRNCLLSYYIVAENKSWILCPKSHYAKHSKGEIPIWSIAVQSVHWIDTFVSHNATGAEHWSNFISKSNKNCGKLKPGCPCFKYKYR